MIYRVFYHDKLVSTESSIKDTFYFIKIYNELKKRGVY